MEMISLKKIFSTVEVQRSQCENENGKILHHTPDFATEI